MCPTWLDVRAVHVWLKACNYFLDDRTECLNGMHHLYLAHKIGQIFFDGYGDLYFEFHANYYGHVGLDSILKAISVYISDRYGLLRTLLRQ